MSAKEFFQDWNKKSLKKMSKEERMDLLAGFIPSLTNFYIKKSHKEQDSVAKLFDLMQDQKFAKTLLAILKEGEREIEAGFATVIGDFLEKRIQQLQQIDQELIESYQKAIDKILKKRVKKLSEKLGLDKAIIKELLVVVPEPDAISDPKFVGIYVMRVSRKLYALAKESDLGIDKAKTVKKIFKSLFNEDLMNSIAINILLERKDYIRNFNDSQNAIWNLMTQFALDTLEDNKKGEIADLFDYYIDRREKDARNNRDAARRIQFASIVEEDYPKIHDVYSKLSEKEKYKKWL